METISRTEIHPGLVIEANSKERGSDMSSLIEIAQLENEIRDKLLLIGIPKKNIEYFLSVERPLSTLKKMQLPSKEEWSVLKDAPKDLATIKNLKHPLLYGWTMDEIFNALRLYREKISNQYRSNRTDKEDCMQNSAIGIVKALRTDAGIAPFAQHAYQHIRTNIRRPSAESGIVSKPEKRPSHTEVKREITFWLLNEAKSSVDDIINKKSPNPILKDFDLIKCKIQKIGHSNMTEYFVREDYPLSRLDTLSNEPYELRFKLMDYLSEKFNYIKIAKAHIVDNETKINCKKAAWLGAGIFPNLNTERYKTVGDLIMATAICPDFYSGHTGLESDERSLVDITTDKKARTPDDCFNDVLVTNKQSELIECIRKNVMLSDKQKEIINARFAIDGGEPMSGSQVAKKFGFSRQREAQYERVYVRRAIECLWEDLENRSNSYKLLRNALQIDDLDNQEVIILSMACGIGCKKIYELDEISKNLGLELDFVKEKYFEIKVKVLRYIYSV